MATTNYYSIGGDLVGEKVTGGARVDYLIDALGSVVATVDQSAQVVNTYRYKPYGGQLAKAGAGADPSFRWVGKEGYRQTGKKYSEVYVRARHYDERGGRWTVNDPVWPQFYQVYAGSRPTALVDPSGLLCQSATLPRPHPCLKDPCGYARSHGHFDEFKPGADGCIVCCGGDAYGCVFWPEPKRGNEPKRGIWECVQAHEDDHVRRKKWRCNNGGEIYLVCRQGYKGSVDDFNKEECQDWAKTFDCISSKMSRCRNKPQSCRDAYTCYLCMACGAMDNYCPGHQPPDKYKKICDKLIDSGACDGGPTCRDQIWGR
jgi:RHS repeat-associated protein